MSVTLTPAPALITKQEALQRTYDKWVKGDEPRVMLGDQCRYRVSGRGCAIGQFFTAKEYKENKIAQSEGMGYHELYEKAPGFFERKFEDAQSNFWIDLQSLHDSNSLAVVALQRTQELAKEYNLTINW